MSVIKAILFYSKHDQKSMHMREIINAIGIDIETISVDPVEVRERLLDDENFCIDQVPTVLIIYSSGQHKTYTGKALDNWFQQLIVNIQLDQQQTAAQQAPPPQPQASTPIVAPESYTPIDAGAAHQGNVETTGIPKELRRKPGNTTDLREALPSPGRVKVGGDSTDLTQLTIPGGGSLPITGGEIGQIVGGNEQLVDVPEPAPTPKGIKKEGLSAKELARQMEEQREQFDEKVEQNRPFI